MTAAAPDNKERHVKKKLNPKAADLSGYYTCVGVQGGKEYHGVIMVDKLKEVYVIAWTLGGASFSGIGFVKDGNLTCGWAADGGRMRGVCVYELLGNGKLKGDILSLPGNGERYVESWTFLRALDRAE